MKLLKKKNTPFLGLFIGCKEIWDQGVEDAIQRSYPVCQASQFTGQLMAIDHG